MLQLFIMNAIICKAKSHIITCNRRCPSCNDCTVYTVNHSLIRSLAVMKDNKRKKCKIMNLFVCLCCATDRVQLYVCFACHTWSVLCIVCGFINKIRFNRESNSCKQQQTSNTLLELWSGILAEWVRKSNENCFVF